MRLRATPIGVWYEHNKNEWAVFDEDQATMPVNESYNVLVVPRASGSVFVQTATPSNSSGDSTFINSPLTNGNPTARIQVTQNWNPGGIGGTYNGHAVGVWYSTNRGEWAIFNEDGAPLTIGAAFNVMVGSGPSNGGRSAVVKTTSSNRSGDATFFNNARTTGNPSNVTFITQNWNPGGVGRVSNAAQTGAWYVGPPGGRVQRGPFRAAAGFGVQPADLLQLALEAREVLSQRRPGFVRRAQGVIW
jgi:hypothetical protein